jgi:WD40 repeat protein
VGLSAVAISKDGLFAAARSDGRVTIVERRSGGTVADLALGTGVVKSVDFSADGGRLAVSISERQAWPRVFASGTWLELPLSHGQSGARRLAFDARGTLLSLNYGRSAISMWPADGAQRDLLGPNLIDLAMSPDRREILVLSADGSVHRVRDGALLPITKDDGATTIAAFAKDRRFATGHAAGVSIRDASGGALRWLPNPTGHVTDIAVSPDDRYVIGARSDGTIGVWRTADGHLVATLRGHRQRVSHVTFAPDGLLFTAGWDGQILTWDLSVLDRPAAELVKRAETGWATNLDLTLRALPR